MPPGPARDRPAGGAGGARQPGPVVGLIADTHGVLHPGVPAALAGVCRILHAGDVGSEAVLEALARVAPVAAIRGNADRGLLAARLPDERVVEVAGRRLLLVHALGDPARLGAAARRRLERLAIEVVCFSVTATARWSPGTAGCSSSTPGAAAASASPSPGRSPGWTCRAPDRARRSST